MTKYKQDQIQYGCEWFTSWLKKALGKKRVTVEELARRTGISDTSAMYYFTGARSPSLKTFLLIADRLGYEVNITEKQ